MNKNQYRIIFSKVKNMFIAVAENVKSKTKTAGQTKSNTEHSETVDQSFHQMWQVKSLVFSMSLFMSIAPVYAQMQADPAAIAAQQASIGIGQSQQGQNVPVVNIQTPKNGVSHNVYNQFDVLQPGVVLNNSRGGAGSVIVGQVGANPYLQTGEARVILNEVNSPTASRFEGNLEVAGQRADVIIANPSGINIEGGGFINANKAIFTTGKPQLNEDGSIKQFVVDQGKINVNSNSDNLGLGGNNNNTDYVDIYAKAIELNAQVHANQALQAITGSNTISEDLTTINPQQGNSTSVFALDVKALGGMYANNIYIVGTDKGLGVTNAGTIQSSQNLVITSSGKIENTGMITNTNPQDSLLSINTLEAADIVNVGSIATDGNLFINSEQNLIVNQGRIEKNGTENKNIISLNAKGDVNLSNNANVQNFGEGGEIYINGQNLTVGENVDIHGNGSITLIAEKDINIQDSKNISSINDVEIKSGNSLNIDKSNINSSNGSVALISEGLSESSVLSINNNILYSGKDFNISGNNNVKLNGSIDQEASNNINIYAGKNLEFGDINNSIKLLSKGDVNIYADKDINFNKKNIINSLNGKVEISSNTGNINGNSVTIKGNGVDIYGNNIILGNEINNENDTYTSFRNIIESEDNINIVSKNGGDLTIGTAILNSYHSDLTLLGGNINLEKWMLYENQNYHGDTSLYIVNGKNINIIGEKNINFFENNFETSGDFNLSGNDVLLEYVDIKSNKNITLSSLKDLNIYFPRLNANQHIGINSGKNLNLSYLNLENLLSNSLDKDIFKKLLFLKYPDALTNFSNIHARGVTSLISDGDINIGLGNINSGSIIIESGGDFLNKYGLNLKTSDYNYLNKSPNFEDIDGKISLYSKNNLTFEGGGDLQSSKGIEIRSEGMLYTDVNNNNQVLENGYFSRLNIYSNDGVDILGSGITLNNINIVNESEVNPVNLYSKNQDIVLDVSKFDKNNNHDNFNQIINHLKFEVNSLDKLIIDAKGVTEDEKNQVAKAFQDFGNASLENNNTNYLNDRIIYLEKEDPVAYQRLLSRIGFILLSGSGDISPVIDVDNTNHLKQNKINLEELIGYLEKNPNGYFFDSNAISSKSDVNILSGKGSLIVGTNIAAEGITNISTIGALDKTYVVKKLADPININISTLIEQEVPTSLMISGTKDFYDLGDPNSGTYSFKSLYRAPNIIGQEGVNINSVDPLRSEAIIHAALIASNDGDIKIHSSGDLHFEADGNESYDKVTNTYKKSSLGGLKKKVLIEKSVISNTDLTETNVIGKNVQITSDSNVNFHSSNLKNINQISDASEVKKYLDQIKTVQGLRDFLYDDTINIFMSGKSNGSINIAAGKGLHFFAVEEKNESKTDVTKTSSFAGIKYNNSKTSESRTQITELPSKLKASYVNTDSGWNTLLQGTVFETLNAANIRAGVGDDALPNARIILEGAKDTITKSHTEEKNSVVWQKMAGEGSTDQTLELPKFNGPEKPVFSALGGLSIQVPTRDGQNNELSHIIIDMAKQPGNEYLQDLVNKNDVDWKAVQLAQDHWNYSQQGLTGPGAALIVIIVTVLTAGTGTAAATSVAGTGGAALGAGAQAAVATLASQASVSLINNGGDISKTLKDLGSKESIRGLVTSVVTAGALNAVGGISFMGKVEGLRQSQDIVSKIVGNTAQSLVNSTIGAVIDSGINGKSLSDTLDAYLLSGATTAIQSTLAQNIKSLESQGFSVDYVLHKIAHAAAGCAAAAATQKSCEAGAIGAGVSEVAAEFLRKPKVFESVDEALSYRNQILEVSKGIAGAVAVVAGYDSNTAMSSADNALNNNFVFLAALPAAGEALVGLTLGAVRACATNPVCINRAAQLGVAITATLAANSDSDDDKKVIKPIPVNTGGTGTPPNPDDDDKSKVDKILKDTNPGRVTKGRAEQYQKTGDYAKAKQDFDALKLKDVKSINGPDGKIGFVGRLSDGRMVNVRNWSSNNDITLEIQSGSKLIKIRYVK